jgi:ATP synthase protein I
LVEKLGSERSSTLRSVALASGFGCSVISVLVLLVGGGLLLDRHFETAPLWTVLGIALGLVTIVTEFAFLIRSSRRESAARPGPRRPAASPVAPVNQDWDDEDWPAESTDQPR